MLVAFIRALPHFAPFLLSMFSTSAGGSKSKITRTTIFLLTLWVGTIIFGIGLYDELVKGEVGRTKTATEKAVVDLKLINLEFIKTKNTGLEKELSALKNKELALLNEINVLKVQVTVLTTEASIRKQRLDELSKKKYELETKLDFLQSNDKREVAEMLDAMNRQDGGT